MLPRYLLLSECFALLSRCAQGHESMLRPGVESYNYFYDSSGGHGLGEYRSSSPSARRIWCSPAAFCPYRRRSTGDWWPRSRGTRRLPRRQGEAIAGLGVSAVADRGSTV